jgi:hypothetical protein
MTESLDQNFDMLRAVTPLLITESVVEFALLRKELENEIKPEGVIEQIYLDDFASLTWDILRLRRSKTGITNGAFLAALQSMLKQLLNRRDYEFPYHHGEAAEDLARGWFENKKAKSKVATLLRKFGLDEGAIEAEAFRSRAEDLERFDRMLALAEVRRDKALRSIADYRQSLAEQIKQCTDQILENDEVPRLVAVHKRSD